MYSYNVVVLIGSTKFKDKFIEIEEELALKGYLVFTPSVYNQSGDKPGCGESTKKILDSACKLKISKSDIVFVVDVDGYTGSSTTDQIKWAKLLKKPVLYLSKGDIKKL